MSQGPSRIEAILALRQLVDFLDTWHHKAINQGLLPPLDEAVKLLIWVGAIDLFLTDHSREVGSYSNDLASAKAVLEGETWIVHLSDGGYSRLGVSILDNKIWLDTPASLPKAITRWSMLASARRNHI